jgi:V/A-type H+-transporting ATPase subunit D
VSQWVEVAPTRMNLLRSRRRLERLEKGIDLLKRKREALVKELFDLARPAVESREAITERMREVSPLLLSALSLHGEAGLRAMAWPAREIALEIRASRLWGIPVADIEARPPLRRTVAARGTAPAITGPAAEELATRFEIIAEMLLDAAPREILLRRLGEALAQTSRQVHALEERMAPSLRAQIGRIERTLDEREREEHLRLKHFLGKRLAPAAPVPRS